MEGLRLPHVKQEPGEKNVDKPQWPSPGLLKSRQEHLDLSRLILPSSHAHRISIEGRPAGHLSRSPKRLGHLPGEGLRSSGMPHEGYADPVTNDGPRFHSNMPIIELTECVTRAIEASDVISTPPVAETSDGVMITKTSRPLTEPPLRAGAQGKLVSQGDLMRGHRAMARILERGYIRKLRITFLKQEKLSPSSFRYRLLDR